MINHLCKDLLRTWCEKLLELQITDQKDHGLYGGILCPACSRIHGRCFDAIYPLVYMADTYEDTRFLNAAKLLFNWADKAVSRPDGSFVNDTDSDWKGTTVFSVIQLAEALKYHGSILDADTYKQWMDRLAKAAKFLSGFDALYHNNINYRITNALAMQYCSELLGIESYAEIAYKSASAALGNLSQDGFLFGEGIPNDGYTKRGCRAVDMGYNVEESLPSLAAYAHMTKNKPMALAVSKALASQLRLMLPDGGWDNSFGTRNFKWTYWGSRTADGMALGYLLMSDYEPVFADAAARNLQLLNQCTHGGLLHGGPHYHGAKERACVHHTFTHAKVLAGILDHHLLVKETNLPLPRMQAEGTQYLADIGSYLINCKGMLATVTANDWEYLPGGHASGGCLSMLWHPATGPVLCATMSEYQMKEPANMQLPRFEYHQCLSPALEYMEHGNRYTTLYDFESDLSHHSSAEGESICVKGQLLDIRHEPPISPVTHCTNYTFNKNSVTVEVFLDHPAASFICPLISTSDEPVTYEKNRLIIEKRDATVTLCVEQGSLKLPHGTARCYNLVPGFQAVNSVITPKDLRLKFTLLIEER